MHEHSSRRSAPRASSTFSRHEISLGRVLRAVEQGGNGSADLLPRADALLVREGGAARAFITAVKMLGAWACAGALLFAAFSFRLLDSASVLLGAGLAAAVLSILLSRAGRDVFSANFSAALLAAGQCAVGFACVQMVPLQWQWPTACLALAALCLAGYAVAGSHALRALLSVGPLTASWGVAASVHDPAGVLAVSGVHLVLLSLLAVTGWRVWLRPALTATAISLALGGVLLSIHVFRAGGYAQLGLLGAATLMVGLVWLRRAKGGWTQAVVIAALGLSALFLRSPGIQCGLLLALTGRSLGERWLTLFGLAILSLFSYQFYEMQGYGMQQKSVVLVFVGCGLLALRFALRRFASPGTGGRGAESAEPPPAETAATGVRKLREKA